MLIKKIFYRELASHASKIFLVLIFILPVTELFKLLDQAASGNIPTITLVTMVIYGTIASFPMILTISCFLSIVITINRYCKDHEFVIWLSAGISPFYWLKKVTLFALPMALICLISSMLVTPWATAKSQRYADFLSKQQANMIISPGVFKENPNGDAVFYLEKYSLNPGIAKTIFIQYTNNDDLSTYNTTAQSGKIINDNGIFGITLTNGNSYNWADNSDHNLVLHFDEFRASIKQQYNPLAKEGINVATSSYWQLIHNPTTRAKSELSWRISIAIMMFVMCLISVPISIQTTRVQNTIIFILPPVIYALYENLILTLNGYINEGKLSIVGVLVIHLVILVIVPLLTYLKTFPNGAFKLRKRV